MILCIDDQNDILELVDIILARMVKGMQVKLFECPMDAVSFFEQNHDKVKLVISDYDMPMINGAELLSQLKEVNREIKMGIMSSNVSNEKELASPHNPEDVDFVIPKPFRIDEFEKIINAQLER